jgi:hypothetical protein
MGIVPAARWADIVAHLLSCLIHQLHTMYRILLFYTPESSRTLCGHWLESHELCVWQQNKGILGSSWFVLLLRDRHSDIHLTVNRNKTEKCDLVNRRHQDLIFFKNDVWFHGKRASRISWMSSQEISRILWNSKVHDLVHKSPPLLPIRSQRNPVYASILFFLNPF